WPDPTTATGRARRARAARHARAHDALRRHPGSRAGPGWRVRRPSPPSPRPGRRMIRILIVDDEALVRGGLRMILEAQPDLEVIGEAADGHDALEQVRTLSPDIVLMDIRMPDLDGLD